MLQSVHFITLRLASMPIGHLGTPLALLSHRVQLEAITALGSYNTARSRATSTLPYEHRWLTTSAPGWGYYRRQRGNRHYDWSAGFLAPFTASDLTSNSEASIKTSLRPPLEVHRWAKKAPQSSVIPQTEPGRPWPDPELFVERASWICLPFSLSTV